MFFNKITKFSSFILFLTIFGLNGMDNTTTQEELQEQLIDQIDEGNVTEVKRLVESKADVNTRNEFGWTPLMTASLAGHDDIVDFLLKQKSDINLKSVRKDTALTLAAKKNKLNIVNLILEISKNGINEVDENNWSALIYAASFASPELVEKLVNAGADINIQDNVGNAPLMYAVINDKLKIVQKLVELGADITVENNEGETAIDLALNDKHPEIAKYLINTLKEQVKRRITIKKALQDETNLPDVVSDMIVEYDI